MKRSVSDTLARLARERESASRADEEKRKQQLLVPKRARPTTLTFVRETPKYPSVGIDTPPAVQKQKVRVILSPELQERERIAQQEIERKKLRVAPHYSKGAYQYITDGTDLTTLGKKI